RRQPAGVVVPAAHLAESPGRRSGLARPVRAPAEHGATTQHAAAVEGARADLGEGDRLRSALALPVVAPADGASIGPDAARAAGAVDWPRSLRPQQATARLDCTPQVWKLPPSTLPTTCPIGRADAARSAPALA